MLFSLLAASSLSVCDVPPLPAIVRLLERAPVAIPSSEIGEETAPMCLWATPHRAREMKLTMWSADELPVLGLRDAESYFAKLQAEASFVVALDGFGARAFAAGFDPAARSRTSGTIVVLKNERLNVFEFADVTADEAVTFAAMMARAL